MALPAAGLLALGVMGVIPAVPAGASGTSTVFARTMNGISCPSSSDCVAVGGDEGSGPGPDYFTLAEVWNGSNWTLVPSPTPPNSGGGGELNAVSCVSASSCMAVGDALIFHTKGGFYSFAPLAEAFNGSTWSILSTPTFTNTSARLDGVSCTSPTHCMAVGSEGTLHVTNEFTLALSWDGSTWKFVRTPTPLTPGGTSLSSVSCASATSCMAVGYYGYSNGFGTSVNLTEAWNGTRWRQVGAPTPGRSGSFGGVSCAAPSACIAVGAHAHPRGNLVNATLGEQWNGTKWQALTTPNPAGAGAAGFNSVACTGTTSCMATGSWIDQTGEYGFTLAESWNGTSWTKLRTPSPGSFADNLLGVSCTSASACLAVGDFVGTGNQFLLSELWNGTTWKMVKMINP